MSNSEQEMELSTVMIKTKTNPERVKMKQSETVSNNIKRGIKLSTRCQTSSPHLLH